MTIHNLIVKLHLLVLGTLPHAAPATVASGYLPNQPSVLLL